MKHFLQILWASKKKKSYSQDWILTLPLLQPISDTMTVQVTLHSNSRHIYPALFHFSCRYFLMIFFLRNNITFLQCIPCKDSWRLTLIRDCVVFIILITFLYGIIVVLESVAVNLKQGYVDYLIDSVCFTQVFFLLSLLIHKGITYDISLTKLICCS